MYLTINDPDYDKKVKVTISLYQVIDPGLFINIIDLGLIYGIEFLGNDKIQITMTCSTKACPLSESIKMGIRNVLSQSFPEYEIDIQVVWEPEWSADMLTEEGKKQLGLE